MVSKGERCYGIIEKSGQIWGKGSKTEESETDLVVEFKVEKLTGEKIKGTVTDNMNHPTVKDGHSVTYSVESDAWGLDEEGVRN